MAGELAGRKSAFLVASEGVEQAELTEPWKAMQDAGGQPVLVWTEEGEVQAFNHLDKGDTFPVDATVDAAGPEQYDALMLPGGVPNPDYLRTGPEAVRFTRALFDAGRPVAAIAMPRGR